MAIREARADESVVAVDYVPGIVGHLVLVEGGNGGRDALALWQVSPTGQPTGAWLVSADEANDKAVARRLLTLAARRALAAWDAAHGVALLDRLAEVAGQPPDPVVTVTLPEVISEITERRQALDRAVAAHRGQSTVKVEPLAWRGTVPVEARSLQDLTQAAGIRRPPAASAPAADALHVARLLAWAANLWQETELVRLRRRYLHEPYGSAASPLPPRWLDALRAANTARSHQPVTVGAGG